jgi:hypothetical protein
MPDIDRFNSMQYSFQSLQQASIMVLAALTSSGYVDSDFGENLCMLLSIVQVWLAIPGQILGLIMMTVLHKKGISGDPDLKTSEKELMAQLKMDKVTVKEKIESAKQIASKLRNKLQLFQSEGIYAFIASLVEDRVFMSCINILNPGSVNPFLESVFCSNEVIEELSELVAAFPPIGSLVHGLLEIQWSTSVDFFDGLDFLYLLEDTLNSFVAVLKYLSESDHRRAVGTILGSRGVLTAMSYKKSEDSEDLATGIATALGQVLHRPAIRSRMIATKAVVPELEETLDGILDLNFSSTVDLQTYLTLLEALTSWNSLNTHTNITVELAESLQSSEALELIHLWKAYVPPPWHQLYCDALTAATANSVHKESESSLEQNNTGLRTAVEYVQGPRQLQGAAQYLQSPDEGGQHHASSFQPKSVEASQIAFGSLVFVHGNVHPMLRKASGDPKAGPSEVQSTTVRFTNNLLLDQEKGALQASALSVDRINSTVPVPAAAGDGAESVSKHSQSSLTGMLLDDPNLYDRSSSMQESGKLLTASQRGKIGTSPSESSLLVSWHKDFRLTEPAGYTASTPRTQPKDSDAEVFFRRGNRNAAPPPRVTSASSSAGSQREQGALPPVPESSLLVSWHKDFQVTQPARSTASTPRTQPEGAGGFFGLNAVLPSTVKPPAFIAEGLGQFLFSGRPAATLRDFIPEEMESESFSSGGLRDSLLHVPKTVSQQFIAEYFGRESSESAPAEDNVHEDVLNDLFSAIRLELEPIPAVRRSIPTTPTQRSSTVGGSPAELGALSSPLFGLYGGLRAEGRGADAGAPHTRAPAFIAEYADGPAEDVGQQGAGAVRGDTEAMPQLPGPAGLLGGLLTMCLADPDAHDADRDGPPPAPEENMQVVADQESAPERRRTGQPQPEAAAGVAAAAAAAAAPAGALTYGGFIARAVRSVPPKDVGDILEALEGMLPESVQELVEPLREAVDEAAEAAAAAQAGKGAPGGPEGPGPEDDEGSGDEEDEEGGAKEADERSPPTAASDVSKGNDREARILVKDASPRPDVTAAPHAALVGRAPADLAPAVAAAPAAGGAGGGDPAAPPPPPRRSSPLVRLFGGVMLLAGLASLALVGLLATSSDCGCACLANETYAG